jgi:hypothetical protein
MRILILKDAAIPNQELETLQRQFTDWMEHNAEITPKYTVMTRDYRDYPTYTDSDGDERPTYEFLKSESNDVYKHYRDTVDHVVVLVHENNWKSDPPGPNNGIWGTNYSFKFRSYQLHYCRFDKDNPANSFGTFWHEISHSFDAFIKTYINFDITTLFEGMTDWDRDMTHGKHDDFKYIRWRENKMALRTIAPHLRKAYEERHKIAEADALKFINILKQLVILYRMLQNIKDGVKK